MASLSTADVGQLRKFLAARGVPCSGKTKHDLLELANKAKDVYEVSEACDHEESERKRRCVTLSDNPMPVVVDLTGAQVMWTDELSQMPLVTLGDVFAYLISHCKWSPERIRSYKSDDGYMMFKDDHIETVTLGVMQEHVSHVYVRGSVKPEQRQSSPRYGTWLLMSKDGKIESAGCGCVAA